MNSAVTYNITKVIDHHTKITNELYFWKLKENFFKLRINKKEFTQLIIICL